MIQPLIQSASQPLQGKVSAREGRYVAVVAVLIMILTSLPYWVALNAQTADLRFGGFMFGVEDGNSYLAKMRQGAEGRWTYTIRYTAEPHSGGFIFVPYLLLGKLSAALVGAGSPQLVATMLIVFHGTRLLASLLLIVVVYRFIAVFLQHPTARLLTLILIAFGGGLGWLLLVAGYGQGDWLGSAPVDFILPEGYSFYLFYGLPHLLLARAALLGGFLLLNAALTHPTPRRWLPAALGAGACWLIMGLCVPFYIAVLYVVLGVWGLTLWAVRRRFPLDLFLRSIVAALIPLPYLLYNAAIFSANPIFAAWQAQNLLPSPHPIHYLFGYGVIGGLAIGSLRWATRRGTLRPFYALLVGWVVVAPILAYLPGVSVQRRLLEGVFVPLCILCVATVRIGWWRRAGGLKQRQRQSRQRTIATSALLVLSLPTTMLILISGVQTATVPYVGNQLFIPTAWIEALAWLDAHSQADQIALSNVQIGNLVPAYSHLRTVVGHGPETIGYADKRGAVDSLLSRPFSQATTATLTRLNTPPIDFLILTTEEAEQMGFRGISSPTGTNSDYINSDLLGRLIPIYNNGMLIILKRDHD